MCFQEFMEQHDVPDPVVGYGGVRHPFIQRVTKQGNKREKHILSPNTGGVRTTLSHFHVMQKKPGSQEWTLATSC